MTLTLVALALAALTPTGNGPPEPAPPAYYVMRHLNVPAGQSDPDLTAGGQAAAAQLAERLAPARPAAIYVSRYKRTQQSAAPLATRLGLTPIVYDPADTPALVALVRAGATPALIVGHSNTVPDIVEQLGGTRPADIAHDQFGDLWTVAADGTTTQARVEAE
ncbi:MAG: histidine phosphatase family protein [Allosphingosinicella sp.]